MKKVLVIGPALTQSGYGEHTRFVLRSLRSRPELFDVYLISLNWGQTGWIWEDNEERQWIDQILGKTIAYSQQSGKFDLCLHVSIPGEWQRNPHCDKTIGVTAGTESTKISPEWFEKCATQVDQMIVISQHTKFAFTNTVIGFVTHSSPEPVQSKLLDACPNLAIDVVGYPVRKFDKTNLSLKLKGNMLPVFFQTTKNLDTKDKLKDIIFNKIHYYNILLINKLILVNDIEWN